MLNEISLETKISYICGFLFTSSSVILELSGDILFVTLTGLVGGFFGLLGKDLYGFLKKKIVKK